MIREKFYFKGYYQCRCVCGVKINKDLDLCISSEIAENRGSSITNIAAPLAIQVCNYYGLNPSKLVWMERLQL